MMVELFINFTTIDCIINHLTANELILLYIVTSAYLITSLYLLLEATFIILNNLRFASSIELQNLKSQN